MTAERRTVRCAVYTRKSTEEGLEQEFNSLDAQLEACLAYIASQKSEGWKYTGVRYDDGGFSGGNLERPALARLFADIDQGRVDMVVVYKIDLSRNVLATSLKIAPEVIPADFLSISAPFQTRRRRHELRLIFDDQPSEIDQNLLRYVAKGWLWWDAIRAGKSLTQLAADTGVSPRLIANHLPAGMLAPDIVELIVDGRQPTGLTVTRLRRIELPLLWEEQRALLGVGPRSPDTGSAPLFGSAQTSAKNARLSSRDTVRTD